MFAKRQATFPCDICSKSYKAFNTLKNHKSAVHNIDVQNWKSEKQNFRGVTITPGQSTVKGPARKVVSCNICATQFQSVELLAKHLVSGVHGRDKCSICHKKFSSVHFLAKHLVSGDHGKGKEVGVSNNKSVKSTPKVVDVIDVDLDDEPIKFNIPQPVQKLAAAKKRKSDGDEVETVSAKKTKVDNDVVVEEPKHWLDKMMKEVDDFSNNLINLIGDVRKNWSAGVKSEQSVTETTEKLREVLQISKNYIELIDKSVIDEYWANNQSGLWGQVPLLDDETPVLDENLATLEEGMNSLDESVSLDENEESETVCTPDLPDMDLDGEIDLDGEPIFETVEESNEVSLKPVAEESLDNEATEEVPIECDSETVESADTKTSDTINGTEGDDETKTATVENDQSEIVTEENCDESETVSEENCEDSETVTEDGDDIEEIKTGNEDEASRSGLVEKTEDVSDGEKKSIDSVIGEQVENDAQEENVKENSKEDLEMGQIEASVNKTKENITDDNSRERENEESESEADNDDKEDNIEEISEAKEVNETEESNTLEEKAVEENGLEEESIKEADEAKEADEDSDSNSSESKNEDSSEAPPSTGMFLFASWCQ